jgi:hypothetical protein
VDTAERLRVLDDSVISLKVIGRCKSIYPLPKRLHAFLKNDDEDTLEEFDGRAVSLLAEAKQRSQRSVMGSVTKIHYLELLRDSEDTFSRWSRLHLQSLAPTPVSRRVDVRQVAGRKIIVESSSQHDEKHVVPTPLNVEKR